MTIKLSIPNKNIFKLSIGDSSEDGHGKSEEIVLAVPKWATLEKMTEAYLKSVEEFGEDLEKVAADYEDSSCSEELMGKLMAAGYVRGAILTKDGYYDEGQPHSGLSPHAYAEMVMFYIQHSIGFDLPYEEVEFEVEGFIVGPSGNSAFDYGGYGLFY